MKKYLSVFEMIIRSSIYKIIGILALLVIAELGTFYIALQQPLARIQPNLEEIVDQSHLSYMLVLAYVVMTIVLVLPGMNIGSRQSYTLQRLRIQEKYVFLLQCLYNVLCYFLLWSTQVGILLAASYFYMKYQTHAIITNQTIFLAFHRNDFMHNILPMQDVYMWFMLICVIWGTGIIVAIVTRRQRRGGKKNESRG